MSESHLGVKIGDRVVLFRPHPSAGHSGRVARFESSRGSFGEQRLVIVELDSDRQVSVWDTAHVRPFGADVEGVHDSYPCVDHPGRGERKDDMPRSPNSPSAETIGSHVALHAKTEASNHVRPIRRPAHARIGGRR